MSFRCYSLQPESKIYLYSYWGFVPRFIPIYRGDGYPALRDFTSFRFWHCPPARRDRRQYPKGLGLTTSLRLFGVQTIWFFLVLLNQCMYFSCNWRRIYCYEFKKNPAIAGLFIYFINPQSHTRLVLWQLLYERSTVRNLIF